jgi:hypothetical protein
MPHWDVSTELRGEHGKWSKTGVLKRLAQEAENVSEYRKTTMHDHPEVKRQLESIPMNGGKRINGVPTGRSKKGYYVRFANKDSKSYKSSGHAARAILEGKHHDENDPNEPELPGGKGHIPEPAGPEKPAAPRPEAVPKPSGKPYEVRPQAHPGSHKVFVDGKDIGGTIFETHGVYESWYGGEFVGHYPTMERASRVIWALHQESKSPEPVPPHKPAAKREVTGELPKLTDNEIFRRSLPQTKGPYEGTAPSITVRGQMNMAQKADARVQTMNAKSMTAKHNGDLNAPVVVTSAPHGHRASRYKGTTFGAWGASKASQFQTQLHLRSEMFTSKGAQDNFKYQQKSGWWVPVDAHIPMGQAVATHEYGHGVHDEMNRAGAFTPPRGRNISSPLVTNAREQEFWAQFADSLDVPRPERTSYGMDVSKWFRSNNSTIQAKVSKYGAHTPSEMVAELWSEYNNSSTPRPPAVVWGNYVRASIGDKKAKAVAA